MAAFEEAKDKYEKLGIDVDKALEQLGKVSRTEFCHRNGAPADGEWFPVVKEHERSTLLCRK